MIISRVNVLAWNDRGSEDETITSSHMEGTMYLWGYAKYERSREERRDSES